ncbi:MAG TPA: PEP-CTERM sorting domain-containing protein, partial [Tepidisphaeraceae bacterium]|nr:PEP-CTERM sorting domain-containing protein [Tepidisphaeraceae bacterium]
ASSQNLWEATDGFAGWDNDETTAPPSGYTTDYWSGELQFMLPFQEAGIPKNTQWIWHDSTEADPSSGIPDPFRGANHDEFLIFRVPGAVPEPATLGALSLGAMLLLRRSRT